MNDAEWARLKRRIWWLELGKRSMWFAVPLDSLIMAWHAVTGHWIKATIDLACVLLGAWFCFHEFTLIEIEEVEEP